MARMNPPICFGSVIVGYLLGFAGMRAPLRSAVISRSASPMAIRCAQEFLLSRVHIFVHTYLMDLDHSIRIRADGQTIKNPLLQGFSYYLEQQRISIWWRRGESNPRPTRASHGSPTSVVPDLVSDADSQEQDSALPSPLVFLAKPEALSARHSPYCDAFQQTGD